MAIEKEDRIIEQLFMRHSEGGGTVLLGPGDDAAIVRCPAGEELAITTDALNEGIHFPAGTPAHAIGYRSLAVSMSDLASMGARPLWAVITLSVPSAEEVWLKEFADGVYCLADQFELRMIGGDFVRGPLSITVTAHGAVRQGAALRRNGAAAGDGVWVSGFLGDAAAGLKILQKNLPLGTRATPPSIKAKIPSASGEHPGKKNFTETETLVRRFCYPEPRVRLGRQLRGIASACLDLSDGLMMDLPRLLRRSKLAACIEVEKLPISDALREYAGLKASHALALAAGDDYELCFTVPPGNEHLLENLSVSPPLTRIGELNAGEGLAVMLDGKAWQPSAAGFRHFS